MLAAKSLLRRAVTEPPICRAPLRSSRRVPQAIRQHAVSPTNVSRTLPVVLSSCSHFKPIAVSLGIKGSGSDHKCYTDQPVWIKCCRSPSLLNEGHDFGLLDGLTHLMIL